MLRICIRKLNQVERLTVLRMEYFTEVYRKSIDHLTFFFTKWQMLKVSGDFVNAYPTLIF